MILLDATPKETRSTVWQVDRIPLTIGVYGWTEGAEKVTKTTTQLRGRTLPNPIATVHAVGSNNELRRFRSPDGFLFIRLSFGDGATPLRALQAHSVVSTLSDSVVAID